jgi:hypothetical protein
MLSGARAGAWIGLGLALLAVIIGFAVIAAQLGSGAGPRTVLGFMLAMVLVLPNLISWVALAGMGATLQFGGSVIGFGGSVSVGIFGAAGAGAADVHMPPYLLLLLLIPLASTVSAGFVAARCARQPRLAVRAALGAGVPLVIGSWLLAWISSGHVASSYGSANVAISSVAAMFLPPMWAIGGTWLGAMLYLARQHSGTGGTADSGASDATAPPRPGRPPYPPQVSCPRCGNANDPDGNYCDTCGVLLSAAT